MWVRKATIFEQCNKLRGLKRKWYGESDMKSCFYNTGFLSNKIEKCIIRLGHELDRVLQHGMTPPTKDGLFDVGYCWYITDKFLLSQLFRSSLLQVRGSDSRLVLWKCFSERIFRSLKKGIYMNSTYCSPHLKNWMHSPFEVVNLYHWCSWVWKIWSSLWNYSFFRTPSRKIVFHKNFNLPQARVELATFGS